MAQGFIKNKETPTVGDAAWSNAIELTGTVSSDDGHDANSRPLPSSGHMSHVDIIFSSASSATTLLFDLRITYDQAGRDPVFPPLSGQRTKNSRVSNIKHQCIGVDADGFGFTVPASCVRNDGTSALGSLFAHINPNTADSSSVVIDTIRINWNDNI
jgi:hypothetical protein|tara:strand:+ start:739 stop:1209 length:471 start_codon:yes stop_codon:yes gene_type:complete